MYHEHDCSMVIGQQHARLDLNLTLFLAKTLPTFHNESAMRVSLHRLESAAINNMAYILKIKYQIKKPLKSAS